jgi:hypothetical protein
VKKVSTADVVGEQIESTPWVTRISEFEICKETAARTAASTVVAAVANRGPVSTTPATLRKITQLIIPPLPTVEIKRRLAKSLLLL